MNPVGIEIDEMRKKDSIVEIEYESNRSGNNIIRLGRVSVIEDITSRFTRTKEELEEKDFRLVKLRPLEHTHDGLEQPETPHWIVFRVEDAEVASGLRSETDHGYRQPTRRWLGELIGITDVTDRFNEVGLA